MDRLAQDRVVAILRATDGTHLPAAIDALVDAGITALEVTLPTPGAQDAIRAAVQRHGSRVAIGAGTVLTCEEVDAAADAGATFIVTPNSDPVVIARGRDRGLLPMPGALTPTEILAASRAGAAAVKVFPARTVGPGFFTDVAAPLPGIPLIAVGGVGLNDIPDYLAAGALAVGLGSPLLGDALEGGSLRKLQQRATVAVGMAAR